MPGPLAVLQPTSVGPFICAPYQVSQNNIAGAARNLADLASADVPGVKIPLSPELLNAAA